MELFSRGKWITAASHRFIPNLYLEFSETFRLGALASSYALYLCARNNYAVYVNDALAGFGQAIAPRNHLVLFISRRIAPIAAKHGAHSRLNARNA